MTYSKHTVHCVLDSGATASLISLRKAQELKLKIWPTVHTAVQVDGVSGLRVLGEVHTEFTRGNLALHFSALVVNKLGTDVLGGTNFLKENDIYARMAKDTIVIKGTNIFHSTPVEILQMDQTQTKSQLVQVSKTQTILSGDSIQCEIPLHFPSDGVFFVEPKQSKLLSKPTIVTASNHLIHLVNDSPHPVKVKKNEQVAQLRLSVIDNTETKPLATPEETFADKFHSPLLPATPFTPKSVKDILSEVNLSTLSPAARKPFEDTISAFPEVFQTDLPGYNNHFGPVYASIEFGSRARPPPHKTRVPSYGSHGLKLFNQKAMAMVDKGVLIDPYKLGVQPSLILDAWVVKKPAFAKLPWEECQEKHVRLVTGFDPLNKYLKQIPPKASNPMSVYTSLAGWKYLGELDFTDMYWQLHMRLTTNLDRKQLQYLCIRTACGTLAYARAPIGLLGMDAVQEELTDKLLGDLVIKGSVAKVADNVYFGGETLADLHIVFEEIVKRCHLANLRLKPSKVALNIKHADILGLHWSNGTLTPSHHKLDPLAHCEKPRTVKGLRSFLGAVRFNEICLPSKPLTAATELLDEQIPSQRPGQELIAWDEKLTEAFRTVQELLKTPEVVYVPRKGDELFICSDGAPSASALGTKLLIKREGESNLLPSFNYGLRIKNNMRNWSPCEFEAYSISQGIKKMKPFLRFAETPSTALVDSKATVQAVQKMENGVFSTSRRLQDLLANLSAERVKVLHMSAKLSSPILRMVDFASRNPVECSTPGCTICKDSENPDVTFFGKISIPSADPPVPSLSIPIWKDIQTSSPNLRRAASLLESGKIPHKKEKINDIRSYLRHCTLSKDGLVIAKNDDKSQPFQTSKTSRIVIPREFAYSYAVVLHRKFAHPLPGQMLKLFNRHFFMLNAETIIKQVTEHCDPCQASKIIPKETLQFTTETKPSVAGIFFNADVLVDSGQKILVLRDNLTSFTDAQFIPNEQKPTMRDNLIIVCSKLRSNVPITIRVDSQSSLKSLKNDKSLSEESINLEIGNSKNRNKNAVAEKAIGELRTELIKVSPGGGPFSAKSLAKAVFNLNNRIRHTGRSARELWVRRDQTSFQGLNFQDQDISDAQLQKRLSHHESAAKFASRNGPPVALQTINVGDRVFIKSDKSKSKARDPYLVLSHVPNKPEVTVQKLLDHNNRSNVLTVQLQNIYKPPDPVKLPPTLKPLPPSTTGDRHVHTLPDVKHQPYLHVPPSEHNYSTKNTTHPYTPFCFYCSNMGKLDVAHDDKTCRYLQHVKRPPLVLPPGPDSDSSDDEGYLASPLDDPPGHDAPYHDAHGHAMQEDLISPPPSLSTRPSRAVKPPARYSPSPRERRRRQSNAKYRSKHRTSDSTNVTPVITFQGRRWGPPVAVVEQCVSNLNDEVSTEESSSSEVEGAKQ